MKRFVLLTIMTLALSVGGLASTNAKGLTGTVSGTADQIGGGANHSYQVTMTLNGETGTIDYPSLKCGGTVTHIINSTYPSNVGSTFYREHITYGNCIDDGIFSLQDLGDSWFWRWDKDTSSGHVEVDGKLYGTLKQ